MKKLQKKPILSYVSKNFVEEMTVEQAAEMCALSKKNRKFINCFERNFKNPLYIDTMDTFLIISSIVSLGIMPLSMVVAFAAEIPAASCMVSSSLIP